jgi:hypothetical protein
MGVDALDLAFRLEKRLGIKIGQAEGMAVLFDTAGSLHRYLVAKVRGVYRQVPRIEPLFLEVSQAVNQVTGRWRLSSSFDLNKKFASESRQAMKGQNKDRIACGAQCSLPCSGRCL